MALLTLYKVRKEFGSGSITVTALQDISFEIEKGEFTVFAGPSGSGKTTLLNMIGCLDIPSNGEILIGGKNITQMNQHLQADFRREKIGFIFQSYNLIPVLTAFENVEFSLTLLKKYSKEEREARVYSILKEVGLDHLAKRRPSEMSGGQQQRIAIARALVKEPDLVLADEPTANLDSVTGESILELMRDLNQSKKITFLFSSHDKMVINNAKRVIRLRDGRLEGEELRINEVS